MGDSFLTSCTHTHDITAYTSVVRYDHLLQGMNCYHLCYFGSLVYGRFHPLHHPLTPPTHLSLSRIAKSLLGVDISPLLWNEGQRW